MGEFFKFIKSRFINSQESLSYSVKNAEKVCAALLSAESEITLIINQGIFSWQAICATAAPSISTAFKSGRSFLSSSNKVLSATNLSAVATKPFSTLPNLHEIESLKVCVAQLTKES